jgi:NADH-quinone oxidoreductase subunit E
MEPILEKLTSHEGALIMLLQDIQDAYGYLPEDALARLGRETKIPLSQIYGVVTFYSQFYLEPRGRNIARICLGTACHVRGAPKVLDRAEETLGIKAGETTEDMRYTLETVNCLGCCALGPVMLVNDEAHGKLPVAKVEAILEAYE